MSPLFNALRKLSTEVAAQSTASGPNVVRRTLNSIVSFYEECIGLAEVHKARSDVTQCEDRLYHAQLERREKQTELKKLQCRLKEIHSELDRTARGEDRYLHLLTEEHAAIKKEQTLLTVFEELEKREREAFTMLSSKVRASHEREREREERTKYWSLTASLIGAFFGILGTSISNELRMRRFREMIPTSQEVRPVLDQITQLVHKEQTQVLQVAQFITDVKEVLRYNTAKLQGVDIQKANGTAEEIVGLIKDQNAVLAKQLDELKRLIVLDKSLNIDPKAVVYVGDDMENLLRQTEDSLESKMKLQTLISVVIVYSVLGLTAPLLYFLLKKD